MAYPDNILEKLRAKSVKLTAVDALALAEKAGSGKAVNVVLLGMLSSHMDFPEEVWQAALAFCVKPAFLEMNRQAFALGRGL
jgi:indolepyruvate ferredoxin oxidoreductase beta subunit